MVLANGRAAMMFAGEKRLEKTTIRTNQTAGQLVDDPDFTGVDRLSFCR